MPLGDKRKHPRGIFVNKNIRTFLAKRGDDYVLWGKLDKRLFMLYGLTLMTIGKWGGFGTGISV